MGCLLLCACFHSGRKIVKHFQEDTIPFQPIPLKVIENSCKFYIMMKKTTSKIGKNILEVICFT